MATSLYDRDRNPLWSAAFFQGISDDMPVTYNTLRGSGVSGRLDSYFNFFHFQYLFRFIYFFVIIIWVCLIPYRRRLSRVHWCTRQKLDSVVCYYYKKLRLWSLFTRLQNRFFNYCQHPKRGNTNNRFRESQNKLHLMSLFYYFIETRKRMGTEQGTVVGEYNIQSLYKNNL